MSLDTSSPYLPKISLDTSPPYLPRLTVLSWLVSVLVKPFEKIGLFALIIYVPYVVLVFVLTMPIVVFYIFPSLNLSIRLILQVFVFMFGLCKR